MARLFGDGFDMYAAVSDVLLGRWTSSVVASSSLISGAATAFNTGRAFDFNGNGCSLIANFETATNETTVYFSLRFKNSGSNSGQILSLQFRDGVNVQCTIDFRGDNAILVHSGATAGATLATLTSAYSAATWDSYQGKIVINNTTGSVEIRKNGSVTPIINISGVNTRAGSTNAYVNVFALLQASASWSADVDDVWLNSDNGAAPTSWPGDVRCVTSMVASDSSVAFSKTPNPASVTPSVTNTSLSKASGAGVMGQFTASFTGMISSAVVQINTGGTGNLKAAIYDSNRVIVLATSNAVINPVAGPNTITFGTPLAVTKGTVYHLAFDTDFTVIYSTMTGAPANTFAIFTTAYASFPGPSPSVALGNQPPVFTISIAPTQSNEFVSELTEDGDTSYVYSSTVSQEDKYGIAALSVTPASIIGVAPFVMWKKSDSGARTGTVSVTANGSADTAVAAITGITPSLSYTYKTGFMPLDPTGAAWTTANVNSMVLGLTVAS